MKLLVTGSSGLVGSEAIKLFTEKGWDVVGIDNNNRSLFFGTRLKETSLNVDILDGEAMRKLFFKHKFDAVIHTAAQPSHDYSTNNIMEDFMINATGTVMLLELVRVFYPEAVFVHVSTDKVYGENMKGDKPFDERLGLDFAGHRSFFGCSKTAADIYAQEYANEFGMKVGIFRPGCITGRNHEGAEQHGFLAYLAKCIKTGKTYKIFGNGKTVRDQIHAYDLVTAFAAFIDDPKPGAVYNIGGGIDRSVSILEAIQLIEKETAQTCSYEFHEKREGDRDWDVHDVSRFRKDFPEWDYKYSLSDIIKDICQK